MNEMKIKYVNSFWMIYVFNKEGVSVRFPVHFILENHCKVAWLKLLNVAFLVRNHRKQQHVDEVVFFSFPRRTTPLGSYYLWILG